MEEEYAHPPPHTTPAAIQSFASPSPIKRKENQEVNVQPRPNKLRRDGPSTRPPTLSPTLDKGFHRKLPSHLPPIGLINLGNTCYLNAILQSCLAMKPFCSVVERVALQAGPQKNELGDGLVAGMHDCVIGKKRRAGNPFAPAMSPKSVLMALKRRFPSFFIDNLQQDAHEVFCKMIECIESELSKQSSQEFSRMFNFNLNHMFRCCSCGETSNREEMANHISLALPSVDQAQFPNAKILELERLFDGFLETEEIKKDCEKCMKRGTTHTLKHAFKSFPSILVLHVKRFTTCTWKSQQRSLRRLTDKRAEDTELWTKARNKVMVPQTLTVGHSQHGVDLSTTPAKYRLIATVNHHGDTAEHGHYTADVVYGGRWYRCNDGRVSANSSLDLEAAYMAFYESTNGS